MSKIAPGKVEGYDGCLTAMDGILNKLDMPYLDLLLVHTPKLGGIRRSSSGSALSNPNDAGR